MTGVGEGTSAPERAGAGASLLPFASSTGFICVLALDHRDAMRHAYQRVGVEPVSDQVMLEAKRQIIEELGSPVSAILLDSLAVTLPRPASLGVMMPLETQGYEHLDGGRLNRLMADFDPSEAARYGAQGCKLLLYYRADHRATAERQWELAAAAAQECHRHGLALIVEPKVYRLADEGLDAYEREFGELVIAGARDLARSGADLLKLQYPGDPARCERLTEAAAPLPWTLLGGEIDGETFASQLHDSCAAGACGFIAGRAIWGDALALAPAAAREWLRQHSLPLCERLCKITELHARRIV